MKGIILCLESDLPWIRETFEVHPLLLPICNKPYLEYLLDLFVLLGVKSIRVLTDEPDTMVEDYFGKGDRWGVAISYSAIKKQDSLALVLKKNESFCRDSDIVICEGGDFFSYNKSDQYTNLLKQEEGRAFQVGEDEGRLVFLPCGCAAELPHSFPVKVNSGIGTVSLRSIKEYFNLCQSILGKHSEKYVLPGYNNESDVYLGHNVEITKTVRINKPVMIGNNVALKPGSVIGPDVIIGSNVMIDGGTTLENSIVHDRTYIGRELEIKDKIVSKNRLIDPQDGTTVNFEDAFIFSKMTSGSFSLVLRRLVHWLVSWPIVLLQILPFLLFSGLLKAGGKKIIKARNILLSSEGLVAKLPIGVASGKNNTSLLEKMFYALSLDKFPLLFAVLAGKLSLIGNRILEDNETNRKLLCDFRAYTPGVFSYSESEPAISEGYEVLIAERFFSGNTSMFTDAKILFKCLINRLTDQ